MNSYFRTLILALAACMISACAHVPRAPHSSEEQDTIRAQYLAANPDGRFNDKVERGEIARGMIAPDVLASWGVPDERLREKNHPKEESWFYVERDEHSQDFIIYEIVFENSELECWYMSRATAGSGGLFSSGASSYATFRDARVARLSAPSPAAGTSSSAQKK